MGRSVIPSDSPIQEVVHVLGPELGSILVLDLTRWMPGPYASLVLADLGAKVIKVEQPDSGDPMRQVLGSPQESEPGLFELVNRGKESLTLNLKHPAGKAILSRLAETADVLLEGFRPGVMHRLGLGFDDLAKANRGLVYASISAYGQTGLYRPRAGHDLACIALAGLLGLTGSRGGPPVIPGLPLADLFSAMWTVVGVLAALMARQQSGRGQCLDVSMLDSISSLMAVPLAEWRATRHTPGRGTMWLTGSKACYNVYETADGGYMALAALEPGFWEAFCCAVKRMDWVPRQYEADQVSLIAEVAALFQCQTRDHWTAILETVDCCCEPVLALDEAFSHRQVLQRGLFSDQYLLTPLGKGAEVLGEAPGLGQHTDEILGELGYSADEILRLRQEGAV